MTPERWQRVNELFHCALEREPTQRAAFLDQACADDPELRKEVESLIGSNENSESFIEAPGFGAAAQLLAEQSPDLSAGQRIGHYKILSLLGRGGMGEVYLAHDTTLGRKVAIKLLPASLTKDEVRVRRFEQEARAASALNHPNIVTIHEVGKEDVTHFIVNEFIDGETLRQKMDDARMPLKIALDVGIQVAGALQAAHEAGIVHRDIKPENLMVRRDGYVKVLDFGLAKLAEQPTPAADSGLWTMPAVETDTGVLMGTASYMSPEQATGKNADARSDVFSFGVVLYEMLSGEQAFRRDSTVETLHAIIHEEPLRLSAMRSMVRAGVERVLRRCLEKEPERRYPSGAELVAALKQAVQPSRWGTWPLRKKVWWLALAGVAVLAGGALWLRLLQPAARTGAHATSATMKTVSLTGLPGAVWDPRFSPDGNQVAFTWSGGANASENDQHIYVKLIDGGTLLRLTYSPARDVGPVWSPDGRWIAFSRTSDTERAIYVIPAIGGSERKLVSANVAGFHGYSGLIDWSPDGTIVYPDAAAASGSYRLYRLLVETLETQPLTSPPEHGLGDRHPASSPDGHVLAFVRGTKAGDDLYLMPAMGGEPRQLTFDRAEIIGLAWTGDGSSIVFSSARGGTHSLWRISISGGEPDRLGIGGDNAFYPAISRQGQRFAYVNASFGTTSIWRMDLAASAGQASSRIKLLSTRTRDGDPQISPDGKRIVFASERSGDRELWVCDSDGSNPLQLTRLHSSSYDPHWSPDGRSIAFATRLENQFDIYVIGANGGVPHRMTEDASDDLVPSWSRDGRWIYFTSTRGGGRQVWKMPAEGGEAAQVTREGGIGAVESFDGKNVYYTKGSEMPGLWRMPVQGGGEEMVLDRLQREYYHHPQVWAVVDKGIYFIEPEGSAAVLEFYSLNTGRVTQVAAMEKVPDSPLSVAPDGRWLLYAQDDVPFRWSRWLGSDIMLVENFR